MAMAKKNAQAVKLGKLRWKGVSKAKRKAHAVMMNDRKLAAKEIAN